jgi:HEAT repeat protein
MRKMLLILATVLALPGALLSGSEAPTARAWLILQQGLTSNRAGKRANAVHALRLLPDNPRAQQMAEKALADQSPNVRAAAARALGPIGAASSVPQLKAVLNDKEPAVVHAAAHSLFLLGYPEDAY